MSIWSICAFASQIMFADALKSRLMAEERALEGGTRGYQLQRAVALATDVRPLIHCFAN